MEIDTIASLPTRFGNFKIFSFTNSTDRKEHIAIVHGDVANQSNVMVRVHSECLTGDALGSLRCDCRDQLENALLKISAEPCGAVIYLRQEGRGIGLNNKIKAYALQDKGLDTVEANLALGFKDDERSFEVAAQILSCLKVTSIRLLTNNPAKISQLEQFGVSVTERISHEMPSNEYNRFYLKTKAKLSGHIIKDTEMVDSES